MKELSNYQKYIKEMIDSGKMTPITQKCFVCEKDTQIETYREYETGKFAWFAHCEKH